jgi:hypothetical protein
MFPAESAAHPALATIAQAVYDRLIHGSTAGQPSKTMATRCQGLANVPLDRVPSS